MVIPGVLASGITTGLIVDNTAGGLDVPVKVSAPVGASTRITPGFVFEPVMACNVPVTVTEFATSRMAPPEPVAENVAGSALMPPPRVIDVEDAMTIAPPPPPP